MADIGSQNLNFTFTVDQTNALLNVLGNAPFVAAVALINAIQEQGGPQVAALQAAADAAEPAPVDAAPVDAAPAPVEEVPAA